VRGRSFKARTRMLTKPEREDAYMRHNLGSWPMCFTDPDEARIYAWNSYCYIRGKVCCCCCRRWLEPAPESPLHWQPSLVPCALLVSATLLVLVLTSCLFYFSSSDYMREVTYSDRPGFHEDIVPPREQEEVDATKIMNSLHAKYILVPLMQRYLILLLAAWFLHFCVFEPLLLIVHLFFGEHSFDDAWDWFVGSPLMRCLHSCCRCFRCCRRRSGEVVSYPEATGELPGEPGEDTDAEPEPPTPAGGGAGMIR